MTPRQARVALGVFLLLAAGVTGNALLLQSAQPADGAARKGGVAPKPDPPPQRPPAAPAEGFKRATLLKPGAAGTEADLEAPPDEADIEAVRSIQRELKRAQLVAKYAKKYNELKATANDAKKSDEERYAARLELQKLPRNAYPTRQRNRCELTGRPRGTFRKFGLGRNKIRELAFKGDLPGVIKASW